MSMSDSTVLANPTAVYYPAAIWTDGDWLKTASLFVDRVVLLRRDSAHDRNTVLDTDLVDMLEDKGLVEVTEPATQLDDHAAGLLRAALRDEAVWHALD